MILKVINDQRPVKDGQIVVFVTGKNSVNTYPKYLRVGEVMDAKELLVRESGTNRLWRLYASSVITVGDEGRVYGIEPVLKKIDYLK